MCLTFAEIFEWQFAYAAISPRHARRQTTDPVQGHASDEEMFAVAPDAAIRGTEGLSRRRCRKTSRRAPTRGIESSKYQPSDAFPRHASCTLPRVLALRQEALQLEGDQFSQVLGEVGSILDRAGIPHALIGGIASSVLGRPRSTSDIDVFVRPSDAGRALNELAAHGYDTDRLDEAWIFKASKNGIQIDLIFYTRYGIFLDDTMIAKSRVASFRGARVRVVSPEDLLIMKAVAHDEATPRHWHDALGLVARVELDWDYLLARSTCAQRRVFSLILYAQSLDYWIPSHVISTLARRVVEG